MDHSSSSRGSNHLIDVGPLSNVKQGSVNAALRIEEVGEMNT